MPKRRLKARLKFEIAEATFKGDLTDGSAPPVFPDEPAARRLQPLLQHELGKRRARKLEQPLHVAHPQAVLGRYIRHREPRIGLCLYRFETRRRESRARAVSALSPRAPSTSATTEAEKPGASACPAGTELFQGKCMFRRCSSYSPEAAGEPKDRVSVYPRAHEHACTGEAPTQAIPPFAKAVPTRQSVSGSFGIAVATARRASSKSWVVGRRTVRRLAKRPDRAPLAARTCRQHRS